ncbi:MAG: type II secretion system protein E, partial [Methanoregula sp.]|nr:type II secretion system protein E [Methanoregula sp.]
MPGIIFSCSNGAAIVFTGCILSLLPLLQETAAVSPATDVPVQTRPVPEDTGDNPATQAPETGFRRFIGVFSQPTVTSFVAFLSLAFIAIITGIIVLFIDLPLPMMAGLGIVSLATGVPACSALLRRHAEGAWLSKRPLSRESLHGTSQYNEMEKFDSSPLAAANRLLPYLPSDPSPATISQYWVDEPFATVKIAREGIEGFKYIVTEPAVSKKEKTILQETYARLRDLVIFDASEKDRERKFQPEYVNKIIRQFDSNVTDEQLQILNYYLIRDLSGYGPLDPIMKDPDIEDISCNGSDMAVFIFHRSYGSLPTNIIFSKDDINQFVLKLAQKANKQVSLSNPLVDATLPEGARIQITYSDVVSTK